MSPGTEPGMEVGVEPGIELGTVPPPEPAEKLDLRDGTPLGPV
jgi:hypothetical protein